jgi:transcription elongation factor Elf1
MSEVGMNPPEHQPRMELCPHCDQYNCVNDPRISDVLTGTHGCQHCGDRFDMNPLFRWLEAEKLSDRIEAIEAFMASNKGAD